jgi:hypothetical protein
VAADLDHAQLRAVFVLVAHLGTTGGTAPELARTLRLDATAVEVGLQAMLDRGLLVYAHVRAILWCSARPT